MSTISRLPHIPAAEIDRALNGGGTWTLRVEVQRPGDAGWTNLSDVAGGDWVVNVSTAGETPDQPVGRFTLSFLARADGRTVAPGISAEPLNINAAAVFAPLIYPGAWVRVYAGNAASGTPTMRLWLTGRAEDVEWPDNDVVLQVSTPDAELERAWVTSEGVVRGAPDPGVPLQAEIQNLLDLFAEEPPVLRVLPDTEFPDYADVGVGEYETSRTQLGPFVREWAQRKAADLRYLWSEADGDFRYTLFMPPRDDTTPRLTIGPSIIRAVSSLRVSREHVRNDFELEYQNAVGDVVTITDSDPASQAQFGRAYMFLREGEGSTTTTAAIAANLLAYAKHDLAQPPTDKRVRLPFLPWLTIHDVIAVSADDARFDYQTTWAVTGLKHDVSAASSDGWYTEVDLRGGSPVGMFFGWHSRPETVGAAVTEPSPDLLYLPNFREIGRTATTITYGWDAPPAAVAEVWIYDMLYTLPEPGDPWATNRTPDTLLQVSAGVHQYTTNLPAAGEARFIQAEPRNAALQAGEIRRAVVHGPATSVPTITRIWQSPGLSLSTTDLNAAVSDEAGLPFRLYVKVAKASTDDAPAPSTLADADGYIDRSAPGNVENDAVFTLTGGGTDTLFNEISIHAARPKRVFLNVVSEDGRSSGWVDHLLKNWLDLIDPEGEFVTGAMKYAYQFASNIRPPEVLASLPVLPDAAYPIGSLVTLVSGSTAKLYRNDNGVWSAAVPAVDITGQLTDTQIAAVAAAKLTGSITSTQITDGAISTPKLAAGAVTSNEIAAGTIVAGDIAAGTITSAQIASGTITASNIAAGTITSTQLAADSVVAGKIAAGAISASSLFVDGVVTSAVLATGAVIASKIAAATITADKLSSLSGGGLTINFAATGSSLVFDHTDFTLTADGNAYFAGELIAASGSFAGTVSATAVVATDSFTATQAKFKRLSLLNELTINDNPTLGGPKIRFVGPGLEDAQIYLTADDLVILADHDIFLAPGGSVYVAGSQLSFGAVDSAGAGFRTVRVPN